MKQFAEKFYKSKEWKKIRQHIYKTKYGICELCGAPGDEVHHIIPLTPNNITNQDITLSKSNLILLCKSCHQKQHKQQKQERRYTFDKDGNVIPPLNQK